MANICKNFNTSTNNIQTRVTRMFSEAMKNEKAPLVSYYGAIAGLQELGEFVQLRKKAMAIHQLFIILFQQDLKSSKCSLFPILRPYLKGTKTWHGLA